MLGLYARGGAGWVLGFVALVPWLLALEAIPTFAGAVRSGLLMSVVFVAAVFAWFGVAIGAYTGIGPVTGLLALLLAAPLLQPQLLAFALVRQLVGRRHGAVLRALAAASAWVATEWLVPRLLGDTLGHGLYPSRLLRQVADVGGAAGLSFLLILINECLALAIARRRAGVHALAAPLAIAVTVLALMAGYGFFALQRLAPLPASDDQALRVGMVQSNIYDYERLRRETGAYAVVRQVLDTHYALSREAIATHRVDALLWSETVYPTTFGQPKSEGGAELDREILAFVTEAKVPLVFGTYDRDAGGEYNAAAFVEPNAGTLGFYRKTDLFPLTEYVPAWLDGSALRRWLPWTGSWRPGDGARVFPLRLADGREIPVLSLICLDDVDSGLAIDGARLGAQVILTMSNDSWFTDYPVGANLHLGVAAFRSIETRLPQLRVTANGVSAVIDATGTVQARTAVGEQRLLVGEVSAVVPPATLMVAWGDWVGRAGLGLLVLLAVFSIAGACTWRIAGDVVPEIVPDVATAGAAPAAAAAFHAEGALLAPAWRTAAGLLRLFAAGGLLWMAAAMLLGDPEKINALSQIWMFAGLVLAPEAAAWSIRRAFAATVRVDHDSLVLEQRERHIQIPAQQIVAVQPWTLALPGSGVWLRLTSGRRWPQGIVVADPAALVQALISAGAPPALTDALTGRAAVYARIRLAVPRWRIDQPLCKFLLFPLVPALPAFRLHQHIAFGGTFGEYYTYGLKAYLIALLIWWASWAIGLALFAAALRAVIELGTLLTIALRPERAIAARSGLEGLGRLLFYVGVPAWLLLRLWPG